MRQFITLIFLAVVSISYADGNRQAYIDYCLESGGQVEKMPAQFATHTGYIQGNSKRFCTFNIDNGFIAIGLASFSSTNPSIAATLIKKLPAIPFDSPLFKGKYSNPSLNFCKNLGGSSILFSVMSGGFTNELGQNDICVFGDGSMVSGWSLIYIANNRTGYHLIREKIKAAPLHIDV